MSASTANGRIESSEMDPTTAAYRRYYLAAFWAETVVYGGYVFLFIGAIRVVRRRSNAHTPSAKVFLGALAIMFLLISIHNFTNIFRMIQAFVTVPITRPNPGEPINYLRNCPLNWDCFMFMVVLALLNWISDGLMIFRCYFVWQRSRRVILIPCLMLLLQIGLGMFNWYWARNPGKIAISRVFTVLGLSFPLALSLNLLTTGLIAYRIWAQHRRGARAGVHVSMKGSPSLFIVTRIVVESAMIWTTQVLCITVLYYMRNPAQILVQHISVPSMGIVFVLVAVRTHLARSDAEELSTPSWVDSDAPSFALPSWLDRESKESEVDGTWSLRTERRLQVGGQEESRHSDENVRPSAELMRVDRDYSVQSPAC